MLSVPRDLQVTIPGKGTAKLNAAYAYGGVPLTVKTLHQVLGIGIDHVIDVDFAGFRALVNQLGCVYTDVDRHYFNRNAGTAATNYASIDVQAGYQRLCGSDALDYVRYRHGDNDLVRAARQHDFLRQARAQFGVRTCSSDRHALLRLLGENTRTDIRGSKQVLALAKLAVDAAGKPVQEVPFPATHRPRRTSTPRRPPTHAAVRRFLHPTVVAAATPTAARRASAPAGRPARPASSPPPAPRCAASCIPTRRLAGAVYDSTRAYTLKDDQGTRTAPTGSRSAPPSASTTASRAPTGPTRRSSPPPTSSARSAAAPSSSTTTATTCGASRCGPTSGAWWVSNTLTLKLTNAQMLAIARSLSR